MAEVWKSKDVDTLRNWLQTILLEASDKLTDWEMRFITDMEHRLDVGSQLTQYQQEKLEEIYAEYTN